MKRMLRAVIWRWYKYVWAARKCDALIRFSEAWYDDGTRTDELLDIARELVDWEV